MKLIDADEFAIEEPKLWDWSSVDDISSTAVLKQCIWDVQCAPTVEAIPIEWVDQYINKFQLHGVTGDEYWILHSMLCAWEWEKENGQETTN